MRGRAFSAAYTAQVDGWLRRLFARATAEASADGVALVAVGGYGRGDLSPYSDLDLILLHEPKAAVGELADALWYPVWDEGVKLGHAVRTVKDAVSLAADDLVTATSLLTVRHLAGDRELSDELVDRALGQWRKRAKANLAALHESVTERHAAAGEVAFLLEPDLKEGRGGLRDVHALAWAEAAQPMLYSGDHDVIGAAHDVLLGVRIELHRKLGKPTDRLHLQDQDAVAEALGHDDADALMAQVADAARTIAWTSDETWERAAATTGRRSRTRDETLDGGLAVRGAAVEVDDAHDIGSDPVVVLRAARAAAERKVRIGRASLDRLSASVESLGDPWPDAARDELAGLLAAGHAAVPVLEQLDRRNLLTRLLPEWEPVRSRPQRNAYHQFTVDRHLWEAAAEAAQLTDRVGRPDLLVVGALLHDLGKGYPGDHTEIGIDLVERIGPRMGFPPADVATLADLVRHHLLLPDVATRRDLTDEGTLRMVAESVGDTETLDLLAALTEADSIATGPAAWGDWKAGLVGELVARTRDWLAGHQAAAATNGSFPDDVERELLQSGEEHLLGEDHTLTVVTRDRPGVFSRIAGVLLISGLAIREAAAYSDGGRALSRFRVAEVSHDAIDWDTVTHTIERALGGRLALDARVAERARTYAPRRPMDASPTEPEVHIDNRISDAATVLEVHAPDREGVLYRITRALAELELDIRSAKVQTLGHRLVDTFYVRDAAGRKVTDIEHLREIEIAILHALTL